MSENTPGNPPPMPPSPPSWSPAATSGVAAAPPPPMPGPAGPPVVFQMPAPKRKTFWRTAGILLLILFILSAVVNVVLSGALVAAAVDQGMEGAVIDKGANDQVVAVYNVAGLIDDEAAENFFGFYKVVRDKPEIKAVVLRVDSGGGGVSASDRIHDMVQSIREKLHKPLFVSMGSMAASGGYYISCPADSIYAEHTCVTGSIGVIAVWPVLKDMFDKVGVDMVTLRSSDAQLWKARENYWEAPDQRVVEEVRDLLDQDQAIFEGVVRAGRGDRLHVSKKKTFVKDANGVSMPFTETVPFNGKIYSATDAKDLGLVDEIGYLRDAAKGVAAKAGLSNPKIVQYTKRHSLREQLFGSQSMSLGLDVKSLEKFASPQIMMLWKP